MTTDTLVTFLGWCTVINGSMLLLATLIIVTLRPLIVHWHSRLFSLDESLILQQYFAYLGNYKIAILIFNLTPYVALKVMA